MEYCERIKLEEEDKGIAAIHLVRYHFARRFCQDQWVLDCASGTGYGSTVLHEVARRMVGIDFDGETVQYARAHYPFSNIDFLMMNAESLGFGSDCFNIALSFETVEHLRHPDRFLSELVRVLRPDGLCLMSTPNVCQTTLKPANPHHVREWSPRDFRAYLGRFFGSVELLGVRRNKTTLHRLFERLDYFHLRALVSKRWRSEIGRAIGSRPFHEMELDRDLRVGSLSNDALCLIALCRMPRKELL